MAKRLYIPELPLYGRSMIEASAGTGKTYTIASLVLRLLLEPRVSERALTIDQILIVTFTNAATEELRGRVRSRIKQAYDFLRKYAIAANYYRDLSASEQEAVELDLVEFCIQATKEQDELLLILLRPYLQSSEQTSQASSLLKDALLQMDEAAIFTIHGFCQRVLQQHAFESGSFFDLNLVNDQLDLLRDSATAIWRQQFYQQRPAFAAWLQSRFASPSGLLQALRPLLGKSDSIVPPRDSLSWQQVQEKLAMHYQSARTLWLEEGERIREMLLESKTLNRNKYRLSSMEGRFLELEQYFSSDRHSLILPKNFHYFTQSEVLAASKKGPLEHPFFDACELLHARLSGFESQFLQGILADFELELQRLKESTRKIGFDDLLLHLSMALENDASGAFAAALGCQYPVAMIDEFQDTDPVQYGIFDAVYTDAGHTALLMIGDPKQAIYSFRGADIHTYLMARRDVGAEACYTLDVNFRSVGAVVDGVNALFSQQVEEPFGVGQAIAYPMVTAHQKKAQGLVLKGELKAGLQFGWLGSDLLNDNDVDAKTGLIKKTPAKAMAAQLCAKEIVQLLNASGQGEASLQGKAISAEHIAVLVRDRNEAGLIQQALKQRGVGSVFISRDSVFASQEAQTLRLVLAACRDPGAASLLRAVLGSQLFGFDAIQLREMEREGLQWETHVLRFWQYHRLWSGEGFVAMWWQLMSDYGLSARLLALEDGERRLTNLLQLVELLQQASSQTHGSDGLLAWVDQHLYHNEQEIEEQQLRLESDHTLVQIVTIHKSKGLEYPLVFLPFAFAARSERMASVFSFYHPQRQRYLLDIGSEDQKAHFAYACQDRLSEDLRLYYVALTRARHHCRVYCSFVKDVDKSALYYLLLGDAPLKEQDEERFFDNLKQFVVAKGQEARAAGLPSLALQALELDYLALRPTLASAPETLNARQLEVSIDRQWRVSSYSGLTYGAHSVLERPDYDERSEKGELAAVSPNHDSSIFAFHRGAQAGNFMHRILELAAFSSLAQGAEQALIEKELLSFGFDSEVWLEVLGLHFKQVVLAPLLSSAYPEQTVRLADLNAERYLNEMEFYLPMASIQPQVLDTVFNQYRQQLAPGAPRVQLQFMQMKGMLKGFIDLVFEFNGRFYVADYKSNHLGDSIQAYDHPAMEHEIFHHNYDIQFLIYTLALHRYLSQRQRDYHYEQHFGGVYYLFLRGMDDSGKQGVYFERPSLAIIEELERVLTGSLTNKLGENSTVSTSLEE
jgi:exodeoxyribonuclease V beta subunit